MARLGEQARSGTDRAGAQCGLADGLHAPRWTEANLDRLVPAWDALARSASTPNPFFESWFLLPSLRRFDAEGEVRLVLLVERGRLAALMPSWHDPVYHGRRLRHLSAWLHPNVFCGAPLIAPGHEQPFWRAYLRFADSGPGRSLFLHLPQMPEDSPAARALVQVCAEQDRSCRAVVREARAMLRHGLSPEEHLASAMSAKKRKELRRQRKRLEELGVLTVERRRNAEELDRWIDNFLELERRGWKGAQGSALASIPGTAALFREALTGAAEAGQLERLDLSLDGRPIAMLATFLSPPGAFAFKTAFDESFARFSPGMLLQIENLALLEDQSIGWCDSCAAADHPMIERIWRERRDIAWFTVAIGGRLRRAVGEALTALEMRRAGEGA